jgi:hypothetical protein
MRSLWQWIGFIAAVVLLVLAVFCVQNRMEAQAKRPAPVKQTREQHPEITVRAVKTGSYQAEVTS